MDDRLEVTQADRDRAADAVLAIRGQKNGDWQGRIRKGECDDGTMVQSMLHARLAGVKEGLEMAATGERPDDDTLEPHLPEYIEAEKRCGIQRSDWIPSWYVPWSPRNDNQNAEGPWSHWVALAHAILAADQAAIRAIPVKADDRERA